ncbi:hypothetical protein E2P81_ATG09116 [Venturia nashicola]|nr:hypothetical protein E2P81_ATG09116 [Venturia nashicola]
MDIERPFEYPHGIRNSANLQPQRRQMEPSFIDLHHPRGFVMSDPEALGPQDFNSYSYPTNAQEPPSQTQNQAPRMNGNATPWASMNINSIPHGFYGGFQSQYSPAEPYPYPGHMYTSPVHSLTIPPPDVVARERLALALAMEQRAAAREARNTSPTSQQENPAKPSTQSCKSIASATRKPVEGECPVCWEPFLDAQTILFCKTTCGNNFHKSCIVEWLTAPANRQALLKCPMCRGAWDDQELKELHQENGISSPRPAKRFRADTAWAAQRQRQEHIRRFTRQRAYERRNSADRSRATPVAYDNRPNFFVRDEQSPQMSPTSPTSPQNQFSPTMPYHLSNNPSFTPVPRPTPGPIQSMSPADGNNFQMSTFSQPPAFGVSRFTPDANNNANINNGFRPSHMMSFQFQPPQAVAAFGTQSGPIYPRYPAMTPQNFPPANLGMSQFGSMSRTEVQGTRTPATSIMEHINLPVQQHPCPAMRQQNTTMPQQVYPGSFVPPPPSAGSQASWEYHQYHYSHIYTVFMNS